MSYYGPASGIYGGRGGNYGSSAPPQHSGGAPAGNYGSMHGAGGHYGPSNGSGGGGVGSSGGDPYAVHHQQQHQQHHQQQHHQQQHHQQHQQQHQQGRSSKGRGGGRSGGGWSGSGQSSGVMPGGNGGGSGGGSGSGGGGYPWWEHVKGNNQPTTKAGKVNVNVMPPEMKEAHLAVKAAQKHAQRLADPEPEKLEVPPQMLTDTFYAARDVIQHARSGHSGAGAPDSDTTRARPREVWGGGGPPTTPPPPSHKGSAYEEIQLGRRKLPAYARQEEILDAINNNQVVVISGETGCGKTTQVPQFVMDQYNSMAGGEDGVAPPDKPYNIVCTQPRRISAIGVAERVAAERGETVGGTVGYQIRLERRACEHTKLLFVTTGILLRRLQADPQLEGVTHVILDEVHERTVDSDFLIIILRDLAAQRRDIKLVLMSATLNADLFSDYFSNAPKLNIPGYTFPVEEFYLEDALELTRTRITPTINRQGRMKRKPISHTQFGEKVMQLSAELPRGRYSQATLESMAMYDESEVPLDVIVDLVQHIHAYEGDGAILIFLSGWEEISAVHDKLEMLPQARQWRLYALHSQMPTSQQRDVFLRPPRGTRKVVIATNIAESSITIDDVVFVIDGGKHKEKSYDPEAKVQSLLPAWVSQASSKQRRGRAGRVQPGRCWHLYPRSKYPEMDEYQLPEIVRTSLESLCLQVRHLGLAAPGQGGVTAFIHNALTPPGEAALGNALTLLTRIGAFRANESLTPLGKHLALLPVEPQIGKALVFGCMLGCLDPVLTIAALLSQRNPFVMPMSKKEQADQAKRRFAQGEPSDHLCLYNAYEAWRQCPRRDQQDFCHVNFLSPSALRTASDVRGQFQTLLRDAGLIPRDREQLAELNRHSEMPKYWPVVRAALSSGLYPNLVRVDYGKKKFKLLSSDHSTLNPHPSSVTSEGSLFNRRWAYYHEMCRTPGGLFIYDLTEAAPLPLLLFGAGDTNPRGRQGALINKLVTGPHIQGLGKKKKKNKKGHQGQPSVGPFAGVEPWVYFNVGGDNVKRMIEEIRAALDYVVGEHVGGARSSESETRLIDMVAQALVGEEELAYPAKPGGGTNRSQHSHGTMQYVDGEDDYEYHRSGSAVNEYRGSGAGAYRGYGDNNSSSSRGGYSTGGVGGGYGSHSHSSGGGRRVPPPPPHQSYSGGGGGGGNSGGGSGGSHGANGANGTGYMHHSGGGGAGGGGGSGSHYGSGGGEKPPHVGDSRYAAAQAAVATALGHTSISGSSAMPASVHSSAGYANYALYGGSGPGGRAPSPSTHHNGGGGGSRAPPLGPAGGPARYNPLSGDGSGGGGGGGGYHNNRMSREASSGSQPRSLARPGVVPPHEYSSSRSAGPSPVSTVLGGSYHNYAVPPGGMPLGGSSGGGGGGGGDTRHYVARSVNLGRGEDPRDRDGHGGRGGKRGRW